MKHLIFLITILWEMIFFSLMSMLGANYLGAGESSIYMISYIIVDFCALAIIIKDLVIKNLCITKELLFIFTGQLLLLIIFFLENSSTEYAQKQITVIFALSMPVCYIAYDIGRTCSLHKLLKWFDLVAIIITTAVLINIPTIIVSKAYADIESTEIININYQSASYFSAIAYSITLALLLFGNMVVDRFKIFKSRIYYFISIFLIILQLVLCLASGGRGGFFMIITSTILLISFGNKFRRRNVLPKIFTFLSLFAVIISVLYPSIVNNLFKILSESTKRTFSFISSDGIDMSQTSNRDIVYADALSLIEQSPIVGYGIFKYCDITILKQYPHNFFLEILLQGGALLFIPIVVMLFLFFRKYKVMIRRDKINIFLLPFICYVVLMLMVSGTYMTTPLFWFVMIYVYSYSRTY